MSNDPSDTSVDWSTITNVTPVSTSSESNPLITSCNESQNPLIGYETFSDHSKTEKK